MIVGEIFLLIKVSKNLPHLEDRLSLHGYELEKLRDVPKFRKVKIPGYGEDYLGQAK